MRGRHSVKQTKMVEDHDDLYIKHKLPIQYCCPVHSTSSWKVSPHNLIQISSIAADLSPHIRREQNIILSVHEIVLHFNF